MDKSDLETLFDRLVAQNEYPGDICPNEVKLSEFVVGTISDVERDRMEQHLSGCSECAQDAQRLQTARRWFRDHQDDIFADVAAKASLAGIEPWASSPSADELRVYFLNMVPESDAGRRFKQRIETALGDDSVCRDLAGKIRANLATMVIIRLEGIRESADKETTAALRAMLLAIQAVSLARRAPRRALAKPGYRGHVTTSVHAMLLDHQGKMMLDDQGRPEKVAFEVVKAGLEADGHFILDLSTAERQLWEKPDNQFILSASIHSENRRLVLPGEKIRSNGRVTIVCQLLRGFEIRELPLSSVSLSVTRWRG